MKIVILGLLGNIAIFLLFAFALWDVYWTAEWKAFCAFLMGAITLTAFAYFIIELSNKK